MYLLSLKKKVLDAEHDNDHFAYYKNIKKMLTYRYIIYDIDGKQ